MEKLLAKLKVLLNSEIAKFENPPVFNIEDRKIFFEQPLWIDEINQYLRTPTNRVGFTILLGYFRAVKKFFSANAFYVQDIEHVSIQLNISMSKINILRYYNSSTYYRHKFVILEKMGYKVFNDLKKSFLEDEAYRLSSEHLLPNELFYRLVEYLIKERIEIPSYALFVDIISEAINNYENNLIAKVNASLSNSDKKCIDKLLDIDDEYSGDDKKNLKLKRYKLTFLKRLNQSIKPSKISSFIDDYSYLKDLYKMLEKAIQSLNLSNPIIEYYGISVLKSQIFQLSRRKDVRRYLYLFCFIVFQYRNYQDTLVDIFLKSVKNIENKVTKSYKEKSFQRNINEEQIIKDTVDKVFEHINYKSRLMEIHVLTISDILEDKDKLNKIKELSSININKDELIKSLLPIKKKELQKEEDEQYYDILQNKSVRLQLKVSKVLKQIVFNKDRSNKKLMKAINYFKAHKGAYTKKAPLKIFSDIERTYLFNSKGKIRTTLYKMLLFPKVANGIKSRSLSLKATVKYKTLFEYAISDKEWDLEKDQLIKEAGLEVFKDLDKLLQLEESELDMEYTTTNKNVCLNKSNKYISFHKDGKIKLSTPKVDKDIEQKASVLFSDIGFVSIQEILYTVNRYTNFLETFNHWNIKYTKNRPTDNTFIAGITIYGCNLEKNKVAKLSKGIDKSSLDTAITWYFNPSNIQKANDKILQFINKLSLTYILKKDIHITHTSSDGQKIEVPVDSLLASSSFKYFNAREGITSHGFSNDRHFIFHTLLQNPADRESTYIIDGLTHDNVVHSDIHSSDTHGVSEIVFAIMQFLGIQFAPRIKNIKDQYIYSFKYRKEYKKLGYKILPHSKINVQLIRKHWDGILRFMTTIILKRSSASQLLKCLNSYSIQNPLYKAIKEFGKIFKSKHILKYIDILQFRQDIQKQLNKGEENNKLRKSIRVGNNQKYYYESIEEQDIADKCNALIHTSILCWNYLYISNKIVNAKTTEEKENIINILRNGSIAVWGHINFLGEYNFTDEVLKPIIDFNIEEILKLLI